MGGINCPPPSGSRETSALKDEYINKLARFCEGFFTGLARFWSANAQIEKLIQDGGDTSAVVETIEAAKLELTEARAMLDTVATLWGSLTDEPVNFSDQLTTLELIAGSLTTVSLELSVIEQSSGRDLQEKIWGEHGTPLLGEAAELVLLASSWQVKFSKNSQAITA